MPAIKGSKQSFWAVLLILLESWTHLGNNHCVQEDAMLYLSSPYSYAHPWEWSGVSASKPHGGFLRWVCYLWHLPSEITCFIDFFYFLFLTFSSSRLCTAQGLGVSVSISPGSSSVLETYGWLITVLTAQWIQGPFAFSWFCLASVPQLNNIYWIN